jgi:cytoskeletal protein CcmA (bactofilin family)
MWKKPETAGNEMRGPTEADFAKPVAAPPVEPVSSTEGRALLGSSLNFEGTVSGAEDLTIEGTIKGTVDLKKHMVTIGKRGKVEGDIYARIVTIEGEVTGNVFAGERASIHKSGQVKGNVSAPRVLVEDGARMKGSIDVDSGPAAKPEAVDKNSDKAAHSKREGAVANTKENGAASPIM